MKNFEILMKIQKVAETYTSKYMYSMPSNWTNGYMQAIRDVKVPFYGEDEFIEDDEEEDWSDEEYE